MNSGIIPDTTFRIESGLSLPADRPTYVNRLSEGGTPDGNGIGGAICVKGSTTMLIQFDGETIVANGVRLSFARKDGIVLPGNINLDDPITLTAVKLALHHYDTLCDLARLFKSYRYIYDGIGKQPQKGPGFDDLDLPLEALEYYQGIWDKHIARKAITADIERIDELIKQTDVAVPEWLSEFRTILSAARVLKLPSDRKATAQKTATPRKGYVYLIQSANSHLYKIGKATNVANRMQMFAVKMPFEIELVHTIPSNNYTAAELRLHEQYAAKRVNGEWFNLTEEDVARIKAVKRM